MKTKITLLLLSISLMGYTQKFKKLGTDPKGDQVGSIGVDIKSLSIATNTSSDSVWILIDAHDSIVGDWGLSLVFDTNQTKADGKSWSQMNKAGNNDLNYDVKLDVLNNKYFPPTHIILADTLGKPITQKISLTRPDSFTVVLGFKLSDLDKNAKFDVVAGSGSFDGFLYDNLPNSNIFTYDANSTVGIVSHSTNRVTIFPNPCSDVIHIGNGTDLTQVQIVNMNGAIVLNQNFNPNEAAINVSHLQSGVYILSTTNQQKEITKQIFYKH